MGRLMRAWIGRAVVLCCFVLLGARSVESSEKKKLEIFSREYVHYHPIYHHGGAWEFHDVFHPCDTFGQVCTLLEDKRAHDVVMVVNTTLIRHMDLVELSFFFTRGMQAHPNDTIAVYCVDEEEPPEVRFNALDFFDYVYVRDADQRVSASEGKVVFGPLINQRCAYQFQYLRYIEPLVYQSIAESVHVDMESGHTEPTQVHIALTGKRGEMRVMWTSGRVREPEVLFGSSTGKYTLSVFAKTDTYQVSDLCDGLAQRVVPSFYRRPGYLHDAVLSGLQPGQQYFYKVGSTDGIWSGEFTFVFPPEAGTAPVNGVPQSFFVFGDLDQNVMVDSNEPKEYESYLDGVSGPAPLGTGSTIDVLIEDFYANNSSYIAVLHDGDLSYARGRTFLWDQFGTMIEPVASKIPYMVSIGNHEYDYMSGGEHDISGAGKTSGYHPELGNYGNDSSGECGVPAAKRFHMPDNGNMMFWYSFEMGLAHHTAISSEHDYSPGSPMYQWLEADLKSVDRNKTPWLFLHLHRMLYCSQDYIKDYNVSLLLREALEPLVLEHKVDILFGGHYHAYERTCPVKQSKCAFDGERVAAPVHLMIGSAGGEIDDAQYMNREWSAQVKSEYGYGRVHVYNASHAHFEFLQLRGRSVTDEMWIISDHNW
ncbi:TPA: hypothetical protein N0F65_003160 [Lagenidium giganteum]|uniref:Purple acid phosphatase n=1 Tax=Lagenidium giganteum TaxID=4803 RepID=A0AAV2ZBL2_9STRA|nr:TPA: hypothetical protein N0F65_003160 [Lagenidium giganteum]